MRPSAQKQRTSVLLPATSIWRRFRAEDGQIVVGQSDKNGEETPQPVRSVGAGVEVDPDEPHVRGVSTTVLRFCPALGFFQVDLSSRYLLRSLPKANAVCEFSVGGARAERYPLEGTTAA